MNTAADRGRELARIIRNRMPLAPNEYGSVLAERLTIEAARTLRRAQLTLHRWAEEECNGTIQREGELGDGKPFRVWGQNLAGKLHTHPVPDREAGALRRVAEVCKAAGLHYYHQTDPRGCALYVSTEPLTSNNYSTKGIACL